jgi:YspA, cpYpsA-related SLOG family
VSERVAIVGSRGFANLRQVREYVRSLAPDVIVVSGGARGVDAIAEEEAGKLGLTLESYRPDYAKHGKRAPLERNVTIAEKCDRMVAFHDGNSRGTAHAIECARVLNRPVEVITAHVMARSGKRLS